MSPPRLHVLPAADVAVVLRRGPSRWWHVLRWRLDPPEVEPGAWFGGRLYPRRSAVSPDGMLLGYYALAGKPAPWDSYLAMSKVPWLHALAAWHWGSTWHWGCEFLADGRFCTGEADPTPPDSGTFPGGLAPRPAFPAIDHHDLWRVRDVQGEIRRGWAQHAIPNGTERFAGSPLVLRRPRPGGDDVALLLVHGGHDFARHGVEGADIGYLLERDGELAELADVAWADWDARGCMLIATLSGELRIAEVGHAGLETRWSRDLSPLAPAPVPAPEWARRW
jgi:hypothetical protein